MTEEKTTSRTTAAEKRSVAKIAREIARLRQLSERSEQLKNTVTEQTRVSLDGTNLAMDSLAKTEIDGKIDHVDFLEQGSNLAKLGWQIEKRLALLEGRSIKSANIGTEDFWARYND